LFFAMGDLALQRFVHDTKYGISSARLGQWPDTRLEADHGQGG
jgi:hypothetical protein